MTRARVGIATLGCRVNQYDSAAITEGLQASYEVVPAEQPAELFIVNTCNVTQAANAGARKLVRKLNRRHPDAPIVVTGCYAELSPDEVAKLPGVAAVVGVRRRPQVVKLVRGLLEEGVVPPPEAEADSGAPNEWAHYFPLATGGADGRSRANMKIQEGCDNRCSFCIIPRSRGPGRSQPEDDVLANMHALGERGFQEIVLAGVSMGAYGEGLSPPSTLAQLLRRVVRERPVPRLRLSSIEPWHVDRELLEAIGEGVAQGLICNHLHLPLQSGDDRVLQRMERPYDRAYYIEMARLAHALIPDLTLGADVLVGFPGEDDAAFDNTVRLIEDVGFTYLHVFPYSRRPGTVAATLDQPVPERVSRSRAAVLRRISFELRSARMQSAVTHTRRVLVEEEMGDWRRGFTDNYLAVAFPPGEVEPGALVDAQIIDLQNNQLVARVAAAR